MKFAFCIAVLAVVCMAAQSEATNTTLQLLGQASILTGGETGAGTEQVSLCTMLLSREL